MKKAATGPESTLGRGASPLFALASNQPTFLAGCLSDQGVSRHLPDSTPTHLKPRALLKGPINISASKHTSCNPTKPFDCNPPLSHFSSHTGGERTWTDGSSDKGLKTARLTFP